jgi:hypothetical protein
MMHFDINTFPLSSFSGGRSFEFYLQGKYEFTIFANDIFASLCAFWGAPIR